MTPDRIHPLVVEADKGLLAGLYKLDAIIRTATMCDATKDRLREAADTLRTHAVKPISEARAALACALPKGDL